MTNRLNAVMGVIASRNVQFLESIVRPDQSHANVIDSMMSFNFLNPIIDSINSEIDWSDQSIWWILKSIESINRLDRLWTTVVSHTLCVNSSTCTASSYKVCEPLLYLTRFVWTRRQAQQVHTSVWTTVVSHKLCVNSSTGTASSPKVWEPLL